MVASDSRQTIHRAAFVGGGLGSAGSSSRVPKDVRTNARRRLGWVALLLAALFGAITLLQLILQLSGGPERVSAFELGLGLLCLGMFAATRSAGLSDKTVSLMGLAFMVGVVGLIQVANIGTVWKTHGHVPAVNFGCVLIVAFPLIVPTKPRYTLVAAFAAAATAPLAILLLRIAPAPVPVHFAYVHVSVVPSLAAALAVFGSRLVHGISMEVAKARELGAYRLTSMIGRGGMGEVWSAEHSFLARPAAIKLISAAEGELQDTHLQRFEREAQVTSRLCSPHTVELYDFGISNDGAVYYAMELLDGLDLETLVSEHGPQPPERAVHILLQMCHSLNEAHRAGLVHRDVKPANAFVCRYGEDWDFVKVLDFGLVSLQPQQDAPQSAKLTKDNSIQGTPACMAPEMIVDPESVGAPADLYALGCVAFWLLSGQLVFESDSTVQMLADHIHSEPRRLSKLVPGVPAELEALVMECLAKTPEDRPASAAALAERLESCELANAWTQTRAQQWWKELDPNSSQARDPFRASDSLV